MVMTGSMGLSKPSAAVEGAFSLVIGTPEGILGARDPQGIRPLVLGVLDAEAPAEGAPAHYVLASETCALDIIGANLPAGHSTGGTGVDYGARHFFLSVGRPDPAQAVRI